MSVVVLADLVVTNLFHASVFNFHDLPESPSSILKSCCLLYYVKSDNKYSVLKPFLGIL